MVDTTKLVGLDYAFRVDTTTGVIFTATTLDAPPGVSYFLNPGDEGIVTLTGPDFDCVGPKGSVTCKGPIDADDTRVFQVPSFQYSEVGPAIGDLPDVDFYSVTIDLRLELTLPPAIGCEPGGSGLSDPGPSCVYDTSASLGSGNVSLAVNGPDAPSVSVFWDDPDGLVGSWMRTDDPANWSYQNPNPADADQGKWMFSPAEIDTVIVVLTSLHAGSLDFAEKVHVTPWKWVYGYGPPQPGSGVMVL